EQTGQHSRAGGVYVDASLNEWASSRHRCKVCRNQGKFCCRHAATKIKLQRTSERNGRDINLICSSTAAAAATAATTTPTNDYPVAEARQDLRGTPSTQIRLQQHRQRTVRVNIGGVNQNFGRSIVIGIGLAAVNGKTFQNARIEQVVLVLIIFVRIQDAVT